MEHLLFAGKKYKLYNLILSTMSLFLIISYIKCQKIKESNLQIALTNRPKPKQFQL